MKNSRRIIGVVGITKGIEEVPNANVITKLGREVGKEITIRGHIILTGGEQEKTMPASVKGAAMYGAIKSGLKKQPGRLISVLKRRKENEEVDIEYYPESTFMHLIIKTKFGNERNLLNGYIPDVIIVLGGGSGTLSEIAFAHSYKKPIVFLETNKIETRKGLLTEETQQDAKKIFQLTKKEFPHIDCNKLLNEAINLINSSKLLASSARDAVQKAVEILDERGIKNSYSLPKHPDFSNKKEGKVIINNDFKNKLKKLLIG